MLGIKAEVCQIKTKHFAIHWDSKAFHPFIYVQRSMAKISYCCSPLFLSLAFYPKKKAKQAKEIRRTLFFLCCSLISSFFQFMAVCYTTWCRRSKQNTTVKCNKNVYTRRTQEPFDNLFRCLSCVLLCSLTFLFRLGGRRRKNS